LQRKYLKLCINYSRDFDPAESTSEKLNKIYDVKGIKGLGKFLKEVVGPSGQEVNELMGSIDIPISKVQATGCDQWFTLIKSENGKEKGTIKLALSFGSNRDIQVVTKEHRTLVKQFLIYELEVSNVGPYECIGNLCAPATNLLTQHAVQGGMSLIDMTFVKWDVFCEAHSNYHLSFVVFNELLDVLTVPIQNQENVSDANLRMFWETLVVLLSTTFRCLHKLHKLGTKGKSELRVLSSILDFLAKVKILEPPKDMEWFPKQLYR
jgi:BAI1-associated protein 3